MNKYSLIFLTGILLFSACSKKAIPTSRIEKEYGLEKFDFEYLQAKTKIKYEGEDRSLTSSATIRMKKDSIIWISITPIFGMEAARGMITRDTVIFLDRVNKMVYNYNFKSLSRMVNFDLNFDMLQSIILGNQVFSFEPQDEFKKNSKNIQVAQQRDRFSLNTIADQKLRKVTSISVDEENSNNNMSLSFTEFSEVNKQAFPYNIYAMVNSVQNGKAQITKVNVSYNKVEVSSSPISFPFSISSKYD